MSFFISQRACENASQTRKRQSAPEEWRDRNAKIRKDAGLDYESRDGILRPSIDPPAGGKVCAASCQKPGCLLTANRKTDLFNQFRSVPADVQSALLVGCIDRVPTNGRHSFFRYFIHDDHGYRREACLKTILDVFGLTERRLRTLKEKMNAGEFAPTDGRGKHLNRPHRLPIQLHTDIEDHIKSYPNEISHYSRSKGNPNRKYLEPNLNACKMIRDFESIVGIADFTSAWLYRKILKDLDFHFDTLKSDTCCTCDQLKIARQEVLPQAQLDVLELEMLFHTVQWESAYEALRHDIGESTKSSNFVTITLDLQQVLFSPVLTNSDYFYQRKYSSYNFGMTFPATSETVFSFWNESTSGRGADEIASGILRTIRTKFTPLAAGGPRRTLHVWSDCCGGQNKNWIMVCLYYYLVQARYFDEIVQNFLVTGHTFLPTDRDFGVIEKAKKGASISVPDDWINLIKNCRPNNPFFVQVMTQNEVFLVRQLVNLIVKPRSVRFPDVTAFRVTNSDLSKVFTKISHEPGTNWDEHPVQLRCTHAYLSNFVFIRKHNIPIPVSQEKKKDLLDMCQYLLPQFRNFYQNL